VWNLPAVFVIEDNGYAESTPSTWAVAGTQAGRARGFDMPAYEVNGHDFFDVNAAAREAIERARNGGGPSLIHSKLARYYGHFEGDAMTYRGKGEVDRVKAERDSLTIFKARVRDAGLLDEKDLSSIENETKAEIERATKAAKSAAPPAAAQLLTDVYVSY
jgi:pyruvate dehydrogenase E1 component alpha subunit